jgi:hypothetical protein
MSIVPLPVGRLTGAAERASLRGGLAAGSRFGAALQLVQRQTPASTYCAACAAPIDYGAVWRAEDAYCSIECSLAGKRPA